MRNLLKTSLLGLAVCLSAACDKHIVYHSYHSLSTEGWEKGDTLFFQIPISDSIPPTLHLFTEIRNRTDYPYRNLYLFISQNLQDSTTYQTDTICLSLTDSVGNWKGKGWGSIYQSETFIKSIRPLKPGNYSLWIRSGMKDEILKGINDIGMRIEKNEE